MTLTLLPILRSAGIDPVEARVIRRHPFVREHEDSGLPASTRIRPTVRSSRNTSQQSARTRTFPVSRPRIWVALIRGVATGHGSRRRDPRRLPGELPARPSDARLRAGSRRSAAMPARCPRCRCSSSSSTGGRPVAPRRRRPAAGSGRGAHAIRRGPARRLRRDGRLLAAPFGEVRKREEPLSNATSRQLLQMLAAGATDESAVRRLGLSTRTVRRLMRDFMASTGAASRFQAGVEAGRRGMLA